MHYIDGCMDVLMFQVLVTLADVFRLVKVGSLDFRLSCCFHR